MNSGIRVGEFCFVSLDHAGDLLVTILVQATFGIFFCTCNFCYRDASLTVACTLGFKCSWLAMFTSTSLAILTMSFCSFIPQNKEKLCKERNPLKAGDVVLYKGVMDDGNPNQHCPVLVTAEFVDETGGRPAG